MAEAYYNQNNTDSQFIHNCPQPQYGQMELSSNSTSLSSSFSSIPSSIDQQIPSMHLVDTNTKAFNTPLRYFGTNSYNANIKTVGNSNGKYSHNLASNSHSNYANSYYFANNNTAFNHYGGNNNNISVYRNRYAPYYVRPHPINSNNNISFPYDNLSHYHNYSSMPQRQVLPTEISSSSIQYFNGYQSLYNNNNTKDACDSVSVEPNSTNSKSNNLISDANTLCSNNLQSVGSATSSSSSSSTSSLSLNMNQNQNRSTIILQINNLDYTLGETNLRNFLQSQLQQLTPVFSLVFEGSSSAKLEVPDINHAKQVVANLHRKKFGHKRMLVSYTRDSSSTEIHTLRCQVAGLLKDVPFCSLPMYKFRELFQSRFKTSISVLDLHKMQDICTITTDKNDEKLINLNPDLIHSSENSSLMESLQESVPYCTLHFKKEQHKGWAEEDIAPLPNVFMTITEIKNITYMLLKRHKGDIPVLSLIHCISGELNLEIKPNDNGINLEHLICCVNGVQITTNSFGVKIFGWLAPENAITKDAENRLLYLKSGTNGDPLYQISREVIELLKMLPKATMKFNRFIPAYHNHFGKQCRVADYGYTKLIELFEALSCVVQIMGDGENRHITLTHRIQIRRFTTDLLRILRSQGSKSILLSQLPEIFSQTQNRQFDVTDYGVCSVVDILDGLVNSNIVVVKHLQNGQDILISIPKRNQTPNEIAKTTIFACEVVELFRNASQYSILFQKFVRSYHYHFGYQCRLSDYGFLKLADLMEAIQGMVEVEVEVNNDKEKKIYLSPIVARRVFAEQLEDLIKNLTGSSKTCMKLDEVLKLHKKQYGYQMQGQTLGFANINDAIRNLPNVEIVETEDQAWILCHNKDQSFRNKCYRAYRVFAEFSTDFVPISDFLTAFGVKYHETLTKQQIVAMKHLFEIKQDQDVNFIGITRLMSFILAIVKTLGKKFMSIAELKTILNIGATACFEFGYPNLLTLLNAYSDIFSCQMDPRSEIRLVLPNELVGDGLHTDNEVSQTEQQINKLNTSLSSQKPINYPPRQPLAALNKIQNNTKVNQINSSNPNDMAANPYKMPQQQQNNSYCKPLGLYQQQKNPPAANLRANYQPTTNYQINNFNYKPIAGGIQYQINSSYNNTDQNEKENSFKNYINGSMNTSSIDLNNSHDLNLNNYSGFSMINTSSNSLDNLNLSNISHGNNNNNYSSIICDGKETKLNSPKMPKSWSTFGCFGTNNSGNNKNTIDINIGNDIFGLYNLSALPAIFNDPPKPDTPPAMALPFWIDPVWTNHNDMNNNVNITNNSEDIASLKTDMFSDSFLDVNAFDILPRLLMSPSYTGAKKPDYLNNINNRFSFDSPDKKI